MEGGRKPPVGVSQHGHCTKKFIGAKEGLAGEMPVVIGTYPKRRKSVIREKKFEIDAEMQKALDQF